MTYQEAVQIKKQAIRGLIINNKAGVVTQGKHRS